MLNKINRAGLIADSTGLLCRNPEGPMPTLDASTGNIVFKNKTKLKLSWTCLVKIDMLYLIL